MADNSLSRSQQLLADMDAKYGKTSSSAPAATVVTPPVQPAPQPAAKKPGGMLEGAMDLISNRNKQIDKAAGYACGGKVKAHAKGGKVDAAGKISGPGTATSDSIPAKISPTGENILVANGERIISVEQDQLLERIAQMLGFETIDAMFEQMTGKPVGPSMKDGMMAAADGASIYDPTYEALKKIPGAVLPNTSAVYNEAGKDVGDAMSKGNYGNAFGLATRGMLATGAGLVDDVVGGAYRGAKQMLSPVVSGVLGNVYQANPSAQQGPQSVTTPAATQEMNPGSGAPAQSPAQAQPIQRGRDANGVITAESAKAFSDSGGLAGMKSGSFYGTADIAGQNDRMAKSLGYAGVDDFNQKQKDFKGYAPGILGDESRGINGQDAANAEKTQRWRNDELLANANRGNQGAIAALLNAEGNRNVATMNNETSRQNAGLVAQGANNRDQVTMRGQDINAAGDMLRYGNPLDTREKQLKVAGLEDMAGLRGKALSGDPKAVALLNSLSGHPAKDRFTPHVVGGGVNELGQPLPQYLAVTGPDGNVQFHQPGTKTQAAAPKAGEVRNGYKFKGGNPADQASWEKV